MTNAESILKRAVDLKEAGQLNQWEQEFVSEFENYDKKQLKKLSSKQYKKLREIADK